MVLLGSKPREFHLGQCMALGNQLHYVANHFHFYESPCTKTTFLAVLLQIHHFWLSNIDVISTQGQHNLGCPLLPNQTIGVIHHPQGAFTDRLKLDSLAVKVASNNMLDDLISRCMIGGIAYTCRYLMPLAMSSATLIWVAHDIRGVL